jgi:uncharacterized protein
MIRKIFYLLTVAVLLYNISGVNAYSQDFPDKPVPPRLVNDLAGLLNSDEINALEQKLVAFNDSTSTQIAIVIVPTLMGYDKADYAQRLGEKWGIGKKNLNNGVLILVKPKQPDSNGQVFITQGYGLEGVLPDLTCAQIVDNDILPAFRTGDYYKGLNTAVNSIISITKGEFSAEEYGHRGKKNAGQHIPFGLVLFIIFVIILLISRGSGGSNRRNISTGGLPFWLLLGMMNSGRGSHGGSWGGFSGGGGGGGGGFGGFGGGSFGGGGAGGSW